MPKVTSIKGGKKSGEDDWMCPHCGLVPADEHANWTCPRIESVSVTEGLADGYSYRDPVQWAIAAKTLGLIKD